MAKSKKKITLTSQAKTIKDLKKTVADLEQVVSNHIHAEDGFFYHEQGENTHAHVIYCGEISDCIYSKQDAYDTLLRFKKKHPLIKDSKVFLTIKNKIVESLLKGEISTV